MSTARFNTLTDAAGGNPMPVADLNQGRAKAWLVMNGTGTIATRDSFNISSITDNGTGDYTQQVSAAFVDASYSAVVMPGGTSGVSSARTAEDATARTSTVMRFYTINPSTSNADAAWISTELMGDRA